jgi:hypothetical protein
VNNRVRWGPLQTRKDTTSRIETLYTQPRTELCACYCCFVSIVFHVLRCLLHNPFLGELATSVLSPETEAVSPYLRIAILHDLLMYYRTYPLGT